MQLILKACVADSLLCAFLGLAALRVAQLPLPLGFASLPSACLLLCSVLFCLQALLFNFSVSPLMWQVPLNTRVAWSRGGKQCTVVRPVSEASPLQSHCIRISVSNLLCNGCVMVLEANFNGQPQFYLGRGGTWEEILLSIHMAMLDLDIYFSSFLLFWYQCTLRLQIGFVVLQGLVLLFLILKRKGLYGCHEGSLGLVLWYFCWNCKTPVRDCVVTTYSCISVWNEVSNYLRQALNSFNLYGGIL